jgi:hypothetical protein
MVNTLRKKVKVKPGGLVELRSKELVPGSVVEVIVIQEKRHRKAGKLTGMIGAGKGIFSSADDVDKLINGERDLWDR